MVLTIMPVSVLTVASSQWARNQSGHTVALSGFAPLMPTAHSDSSSQFGSESSSSSPLPPRHKGSNRSCRLPPEGEARSQQQDRSYSRDSSMWLHSYCLSLNGLLGIPGGGNNSLRSRSLAQSRGMSPVYNNKASKPTLFGGMKGH